MYKNLISKREFNKPFLLFSTFFVFVLCNRNFCASIENIDKIKEEKYKEKLKSFNLRFINLEKNKKTIRDAVLWAFIPCGGFIFLKEYKTSVLFGSFFICIGGWFLFNLYHYKNPNNIGTNSSYNFVRYMYMSGGLFIIGYVVSILVSVILAKMKIFDDTKNLEIVVRPSEFGKTQNSGLNFELNFKNL
jgi:hypothetical protein